MKTLSFRALLLPTLVWPLLGLDCDSRYADCILPASQALDENQQASFDFDTSSGVCDSAAGYNGSNLTLDAPTDGAFPPGFSTGNGWLIEHSSHGDYVDDSYWANAPLGERITVVMGQGDELVSVTFVLGDPVTIERVDWPDGSVSGE